MNVATIMSSPVQSARPDSTLVEAAGLMRQLDTGAVPVTEGDHLTGMLTDRDLAVRGIAEGRDPRTTPVREVMSGGVVTIFADQSVEAAARLMEQKQIRRLAVLDRDDHLVGIVSLGDLATHASPTLGGEAIREISEPY